MTTEDLIKLADAYAKVGDSADISLIKHHRSALKSALEALGREVARLTACINTANSNHEEFERKWYLACDERDQARAELESKAAELESVWSLSKKADEENDTLRAELAAIRAQEPIAYRSRLPSGSYTFCNTAQFFGNAEPVYAAPADKDAGLVADGWKLVPVEPTPEMCKAARAVPEPNKPYPAHFHLIWDAMLAASPKLGGV